MQKLVSIINFYFQLKIRAYTQQNGYYFELVSQSKRKWVNWRMFRINVVRGWERAFVFALYNNSNYTQHENH